MQSMYELKEMLCKELDEITAKGKLTAGSLDEIDKLTHSIKSLVTIMAMEEGGYSNDGYSGARRRDSMGRYADNGSYSDGGYSGRRYSDDYSGRRYSRDEGKSQMMRQLEKLMDDAPTQGQQEVIRSAMNKLREM